MGKLPKNPKKGQVETIIVNPGGNLGRRKVTQKFDGKRWKYTKNVKA